MYFKILRSHDYFGQYGKITKVVVNRRVQPHNVSMSPASNNNGVYVTYARKDDATRAIDAVDGSLCEGRVVRYVVLNHYLVWFFVRLLTAFI